MNMDTRQIVVVVVMVMVLVEGMARPELQRRKKMIRRRKHMTEKLSDHKMLRHKGVFIL